MLILSIDSAGSGCGVCVWRDGTVVAEIIEAMERGQDQRLMPMVMDVMQRADLDFAALDRIAVTSGPGSFTGLRIGLAAARGIGLAADKPVIGVDRFSIFHAMFKNSGKNLLVIIASRRKELYCRYYPASAPAHDPAMLTIEEIVEFLQDKAEAFVTGDIAPDLLPNFRSPPEAEYVACAALAAAASDENPAFAPRPLYLRPPDVTTEGKRQASEIRKKIRRISSSSYAERLAALHAESFGEARWSLADIQSSLALATTRAWGVFEEREMIGFILCQLIPAQSEVLTFCVRPQHRRGGAGETLLRAALEAAKQQGSNLFLDVAADNTAAIALYEKLGFQRTGLRTGYYRHGEQAVDAILFTFFADKP